MVAPIGGSATATLWSLSVMLMELPASGLPCEFSNLDYILYDERWKLAAEVVL